MSQEVTGCRHNQPRVQFYKNTDDELRNQDKKCIAFCGSSDPDSMSYDQTASTYYYC